MKSLSRDDIMSGNLQGLFLVYSNTGVTDNYLGIQDELMVRFEQLGYPFDLSHEGYGENMKIKGLLSRDLNGVYYMPARHAPFMINVPNTEAGWTKYIQDSMGEKMRNVEEITNFADPGVWGPNDWRMIEFTGVGRPVRERGIINWGRKSYL